MMSFLRGTEEYYRKFIELQEKLRKSEEERLKLEIKFNEMIHVTKEEDDAYHRRVQSHYQDFIHDDNKRQERNDRIIKVLERIENRAAVLAAKTETFQLFRKQYMSYLRKVSNDVPYSHSHDNASLRSASSMHSINDLKPNTPLDFDQKSNLSEKHYYKPVPVYESRPTTSESKTYLATPVNHKSDLYNHPIVRKALEQTNRNLNSDLEALKRYLGNRSSIEEFKPPSVLDDPCPSDSSDSMDDDIRYDDYKPHPEKIEARITKTIRWRPKFQMPRRQRFQYRSRSKWLVPEKNKYTNGYTTHQTKAEYVPRSFCGTRTPTPKVPRREDVEIFEPQEYRYPPQRYTDYGKTKSTYTNGYRDHDTHYLPHEDSEYQTSSFRYKPSPRTDFNTQDLSYQLSNYPNLDHKNRLNIEYTVYPKISDVTPVQYSVPAYEPVDYHYKTDVSPTRSRVTWYDHYLGRCQPGDTYESAPNDQHSKEYKSQYESKKQQDNILLNPDRRHVEARSRTPSPYNTRPHNTSPYNTSPYNTTALTEPNGIIKTKEVPPKPKKVDDEVDYASIYREEVSKHEQKSPVVSYQNTSDHEEVSKQEGDVQEYDSTEDQVPSEVLQDDIVVEAPSKNGYDFQDRVHSSDYRLKDEKYPDFEIEQYAVEPEETNEDEDYEEKHDSLQEIQKESLQETLGDVDHGDEDQNGTNVKPEEEDDKESQHDDQKETAVENLESDVSKVQLNGDHGIKDAFKVINTDYDNKEPKQQDDVDSTENRLQYTEASDLNDKQDHQEDLSKGGLKYVEADQPEQEPHVTDDVVTPPTDIKEKHETNTTSKEQQPEVVQEKTDQPIQEQNLVPQPEETYDPKAENAGYSEGQYDQNGQPVYDENTEQQPINYDENGQPIQYDNIQYDENGQPIGYTDGQYYAQYHENGQLIPQYDEHGQPIQQYDEHGQPIQQYDEHGQPIQQYDENGQPIMQYDENGQPIMMYDDNGQPLYQYDQYYQDQQYQEGQQYEGDQQYQEGQQYEGDQQYQEGQQYKEGQQPDAQQQEHNKEIAKPQGQEQIVEVPREPLEQKVVLEEPDKTMKVMEMLDTDTESSKQEESKAKVSNESDFDISSNK